MSSNSNNKAPRIARAAARYRPGKAPINSKVGEQYSDEDEDDEDISEVEEKGTRNDSIQQTASKSIPEQAGVIIQSGDGSIKNDKISIKFQSKSGDASQQGQMEEDSSEYETDTDEEIQEPIKPSFRQQNPAQSKTQSQPAIKAAASSSSEYETDSEEEGSSSSEDDRPQMIKPIFKSKSQRGIEQKESIKKEEFESSNDNLSIEQKAIKESEDRRKQSHLLAAERIRKELQEKELEEEKMEISDTDGKDPEAEFSAWRLRELARIKRERDANKAKEEERAEIERRRRMPEEERLKEDMERAKNSRMEKENRRKEGDQQGFMQKYYHKGSFFQDMDILNKREYSGMTEAAVNKKTLPELMQVRDYGKKGRSKWTHLVNEDTSDIRQRRGKGRQ